MRVIYLVLALCIAAAVAPSVAWAACAPPLPPNDAPVVYLRKDCSGVSSCFIQLNDLACWMDEHRKPSASAPLLVEVGPGSFNGYLPCWAEPVFSDNPLVFPANDIVGHFSIRGTGRSVSELTGSPSPFSGSGCREVSFESITLRGTTYGAEWFHGGSSRWMDVDMIGGPHTEAAVGWAEAVAENLCTPSAGARALHYFFNSRVVSIGTGNATSLGYDATCGETWFYGGEVVATRQAAEAGTDVRQVALGVGGGGSFRAFGSRIAVEANPEAPGTTYGVELPGGATHVGLVGAYVGSELGPIPGSEGPGPGAGGELHLHGVKLEVDAKGVAGVAATGLLVTGDPVAMKHGHAHTPETTFSLRPGSGASATRVLTMDGMAHSPQLWPAADAPPHANFASEAGLDLFVETDCAANGSCSAGSAAEPHLMIYTDDCSLDGPWFDTVTGRCRGDVTP